MGSTRDFRHAHRKSESQTVALTGTLACGCAVASREPELSKPVAKWWCCGAFQKRATTKEAA